MNFYAFVRERIRVLRWSEARELRRAGTWTDDDLVALARDGDLDDPVVLALASCEPDDREVSELVARLAARDVDAEPERVRLVIDFLLAARQNDTSRVFAELEGIFYTLDCPGYLRPFVCDDEPRVARAATSETLAEMEERLVAKAVCFATEEATRLSARKPR